MILYEHFPVDIETVFVMKLLDNNGIVLYQDTFTLPALYTAADISLLQDWLTNGFNYTFTKTGKYKFIIEYSNICCTKVYEKEIYIYDHVEMFARENCSQYDFIICTEEPFEIKIEKIIDEEFETIETITVNRDTGISYANQSGITINYVQDERVWRLNIPTTDCALDLGLSPQEILRKLSDGIYRFTVTSLINSFSYTFDVLHICTAKRCYNALIEAYVCEQTDDIKPGNKEPDTSDTSLFIALFNQLLYFYTKYNGNIYPHTIFASQDEKDVYEYQLFTMSKVVAAMLKICCTCSNKLDFEKANDCGC
jgi:branched-subunit amino acid transport protein AzlD